MGSNFQISFLATKNKEQTQSLLLKANHIKATYNIMSAIYFKASTLKASPLTQHKTLSNLVS